MKKFHLLAVVVRAMILTSCVIEHEIPELTRDMEMRQKLYSSYRAPIVKLSCGNICDELKIRYGCGGGHSYIFPSCDNCTVYRDSVVINSRNQYKLKIIFDFQD